MNSGVLHVPVTHATSLYNNNKVIIKIKIIRKLKQCEPGLATAPGRAAEIPAAQILHVYLLVLELGCSSILHKGSMCMQGCLDCTSEHHVNELEVRDLEIARL